MNLPGHPAEASIATETPPTGVIAVATESMIGVARMQEGAEIGGVATDRGDLTAVDTNTTIAVGSITRSKMKVIVRGRGGKTGTIGSSLKVCYIGNNEDDCLM